MSRNNGNQGSEESRADSDNEFGEFEGFEGAVGGVAHPASSPWATFPDLVRVRTSPGTTATATEDSASQQHRTAEAGANIWSEPSVMAYQRHQIEHQNNESVELHSTRTGNPPDVSLSARETSSAEREAPLSQNLMNYGSNSSQQRSVLPDMAPESERHGPLPVFARMNDQGGGGFHTPEARSAQRASASGPANARVGNGHDIRNLQQPGTLASMAASVEQQRTQGNVPWLLGDNSSISRPSAAMNATSDFGRALVPQDRGIQAFQQSNEVINRRLTVNDNRIQELQAQLREMKQQFAESESRRTETVDQIYQELRSVREVMASQERTMHELHHLVEELRNNLSSSSTSGRHSEAEALQQLPPENFSSTLERLEASLRDLTTQIHSDLETALTRNAVLEVGAESSVTKNEVTNIVKDELKKQSEEQKKEAEEDRRLHVQNLVEAFQSAMSQFLQTLNSSEKSNSC